MVTLSTLIICGLNYLGVFLTICDFILCRFLKYTYIQVTRGETRVTRVSLDLETYHGWKKLIRPVLYCICRSCVCFCIIYIIVKNNSLRAYCGPLTIRAIIINYNLKGFALFYRQRSSRKKKRKFLRIAWDDVSTVVCGISVKKFTLNTFGIRNNRRFLCVFFSFLKSIKYSAILSYLKVEIFEFR